MSWLIRMMKLMNKNSFLAILLLFFTNISCDTDGNIISSESVQLVYSNPAKAKTYILVLPEMWYANKDENTITSAQGILTIRELRNNSALLIRKNKSKNIYLWKKGSKELIHSSEAEWDTSINERNQFMSDDGIRENSELIVEKDFQDVLMNISPPQGKEILEISRINTFIKIKSFSGSIRESKSVIPFLAGGNRYAGDFFFEIHSIDEKKPIVILKKHVNGKGIFFTDEFWYNKSLYLIEDSNSIIIIVLATPSGAP